MTTQLGLYNGALLYLGERRLSSLSVANEARRALDDVWDSGEIREYLLQQGYWNFAIRTVELTYSPSITPSFGFQYAFDKPEDWVRSVGISGDEYFTNPLAYNDEQQYLFADLDTIYWRYVSKDEEYGYSMANWSPSFVEWVKAYLAYRIALRVTGSTKAQGDMFSLQMRLLTEAKSRDAMDDAIAYPPTGSWVKSRRQGYSNDLGRRGNLIG